MICIFTALYPEAQPLLEKLQLKRDVEAHVFEQYSSQDGKTVLVLTGPGPVRAAAAVGYVLGKERDITLVNYGSCAAESVADSGMLYRCCKLISPDEGRTFYPDLLVKGDLPDAEVVTAGTVWNGKETSGDTLPVLHDMEAAAIYEAGNLRLGPHQMHFLKFVSDFGEGERITPQALRESSEKAAGKAAEYIENLRQSDVLSGADASDTEYGKLEQDLHASVTMRAQLRQLLRYAGLSGFDTDALVREMYRKKEVPTRDKREGMKVLQEMKRRIL